MSPLHVAKVRVEGIEDLRRVLDDTNTVSVPLGSVVPHGTILHATAGNLVLSAGQWSADIRTRGSIDTRSIVLGTKLDPDSTHFSFRSGREVLPGEVYALVRGDDVDYRVTGKLRYAFIALSPDLLLQEGAEDSLKLEKAFWERRRWFSAPQSVRDSIVQSIQKIVTHVSRSDVSVAGQALRQMRSELVESFLRGVMLDERMANDHNVLSSATIVRKVEDWVDGQAPETIQIADLCRALHLPRRTLQRAFTETLGVGPARYLTLKRLTAVRSALRGSDPEAITVTNVALRYGFWELGRFATDYRRVFGERPSETLTRGMR